MKYSLCVFASILVVLSNPAIAGRILCLFPVPAKSHMILASALAKELAREGHDITMVSAYPLEKPMENYTDLVIQDLKPMMMKEMKQTTAGMYDMSQKNPLQAIFQIHDMGIKMTAAILEDPQLQSLLKSNDKFDAIIMGNFMNEGMYAISHKYGVPMILFSTVGPTSWNNDIVGNPAPIAHVPEIILGYSDRMNFKERLMNTLFWVGSKLLRDYYYLPKQNELVQKFFPGYPPLDAIMKNTSLILMNSHISWSISQPLVPNMIEIGGFHISKPKPLPKDLQTYLDDAPNGVIYFSMGSNLLSKDMPDEKRDAILSTFSKLKMKVLWKWEADTIPNQPTNLKLSKWLPQTDVLAHPNVKVFITHGGLGSSIEAVHRGIPLVGIPIFGDQNSNMKRAEALGYGVTIRYENLTEVALTWAIHEVLENPKYRENIKRRSQILHDQQVSPLKKATWWIDYVIRHKGARHLRSSAVDIPLYQYLLLDIVALIAAVIILITLVPYLVIKKILCKISKCRATKAAETNKKQKTN